MVNDTIQMSAEALAATRTAFNACERYDLVDVRSGELDADLRDDAIDALEHEEEILDGVSDRATLYDPNNENVWLGWTREALATLRDD